MSENEIFNCPYRDNFQTTSRIDIMQHYRKCHSSLLNDAIKNKKDILNLYIIETIEMLEKLLLYEDFTSRIKLHNELDHTIKRLNAIKKLYIVA